MCGGGAGGAKKTKLKWISDLSGRHDAGGARHRRTTHTTMELAALWTISPTFIILGLATLVFILFVVIFAVDRAEGHKATIISTQPKMASAAAPKTSAPRRDFMEAGASR